MYDRDYGTGPIQVKKYDSSLEEYMKDFCDRIDLSNWNFDRLNLSEITYFCAFYNNKIISINGVRQVDSDTWAGYTRLATDPRYYKLLKLNRGKGSLCTIWCSSSIPLRYLSTPSFKYCLERGAKSLICYCNIDNQDGMLNEKNRKHYFKLVDVGLLDYDGIEVINGVLQDKFILNYELILKHVEEAWQNCRLEFRSIE
jgi:hypothetical protein